MSQSLGDAIRSAGGPVELMRDLGVGRFTDLPDEYTHWITEQQSWSESVALADQSYHMTDLHVEGPDAIDLLSDLAVNSFEGFEPGKAKQLVVANPDGKFIGDSILFYLEDDLLLSVGAAAANNWVDYHGSTGDYDVSTEFQPRPVTMDEDPTYFRYQVQGPDAVATMKAATDTEIPDLGFFNFAPIEIDGHQVNLLRHGMAGEAGYEFWGPYEVGDAVKDAVLDAGAEYDIKRLGAESYQTANVLLGWLPLPLPAIYSGEEMADYREWLSARRGILSIAGSFESDDVEDYYFTPAELGYDRVTNFDHDFVGKDAIQAELEAGPRRKKVTLEWDGADVVDVYGSLFEDGDTNQYMELPHPRAGACPYDRVENETGELVGVSTDKSYVYQERKLLSLAVLDTEYAEPGTELTVVWGDPEDNTNKRVEDHVQTDVDVTVAPSPYAEDKR